MRSRGAGNRAPGCWPSLALAATAAVSWLAFAKLAGGYETGLQRAWPKPSPAKIGKAGRGRWIERLVDLPPLTLVAARPRRRGRRSC